MIERLSGADFLESEFQCLTSEVNDFKASEQAKKAGSGSTLLVVDTSTIYIKSGSEWYEL